MLLPSLRDVGTPYDDIHWYRGVEVGERLPRCIRKKYGGITPVPTWWTSW
jgi:hypothetical protein